MDYEIVLDNGNGNYMYLTKDSDEQIHFKFDTPEEAVKFMHENGILCLDSTHIVSMIGNFVVNDHDSNWVREKLEILKNGGTLDVQDR